MVKIEGEYFKLICFKKCEKLTKRNLANIKRYNKIVMQTGDVLKAFADTASAVDVLTSIVDSIST